MFSELFLAGYPPEDLVLKPSFQDACRAAAEELARDTADGGPAVLIGLPWMQDGACHNAYALLDGGRIAAVRFKVDLPNYGVFDEKRVFHPGPAPGPVAFRGVRLGLPICEDIWGAGRRRIPERDRRGNPAVAERLALLARQGFRTADRGHRARGRKRAAAGLSQPGRRPGRTGVRRRELCRQRRLFGRRNAARLRGDGRQDRVPARDARLGLRGGARRAAA